MSTSDTDRTETELREAVRSYGESVQPDERLDAIRARTRGGRPPGARTPWWSRPWVLATGAGAVAASVVVGAIVLVGSEPAGTEPPAVAGAQREVTVYEVGEVGGRPWLYPETITTAATGDPALDAVRALLQHEPARPDRDNGWVGNCALGHDLRTATMEGGVFTVDFAAGREALCDLPSGTEDAWRQQLAWTVREATGSTTPVEIRVEGRVTEPAIRSDPLALSPVLLESPAEGVTVSSPVTVRGTSDTFEANVAWVVDPADGGTATAGSTMGGTMGERAPFRFTLAALRPGEYTLRAFAENAEDGSLVAEDTTTFTVE